MTSGDLLLGLCQESASTKYPKYPMRVSGAVVTLNVDNCEGYTAGKRRRGRRWRRRRRRRWWRSRGDADNDDVILIDDTYR